MRIREFKIIEVRRVGPNQMGVIEGKVALDLDSICGLSPASIPSEIAGPGGGPAQTEGCQVFFPGGQFIVRETYEKMKELWEGPQISA